jgi:SmpA / OmlA family
MTNDEGNFGDWLNCYNVRTEMRFNPSTLRPFNVAKSFVIRVMLVLMLMLLVEGCIGKRITKANVDQVTEGMSKKQVESILGQPTSSRTEGPTIIRQTTYVYRQGKDTVTIVFKDDKVQLKDSTLSD